MEDRDLDLNLQGEGDTACGLRVAVTHVHCALRTVASLPLGCSASKGR